MRHVVGGESSIDGDISDSAEASGATIHYNYENDDNNYDVDEEERRLFENVFQTDEEYKWLDDCERRTHNQRSIMCYKHYPNFLIDDENAGFPALHEIGETIDEMQLIMHALVMKYSMSL
ncbi:uncharacterized protein LOC118744963 [Rhagoletis pomonella]|nr:uncharacterized protein LOC118744963 [Rhagoletis pomonella]